MSVLDKLTEGIVNRDLSQEGAALLGAGPAVALPRPRDRPPPEPRGARPAAQRLRHLGRRADVTGRAPLGPAARVDVDAAVEPRGRHERRPLGGAGGVGVDLGRPRPRLRRPARAAALCARVGVARLAQTALALGQRVVRTQPAGGAPRPPPAALALQQQIDEAAAGAREPRLAHVALPRLQPGALWATPHI